MKHESLNAGIINLAIKEWKNKQGNLLPPGTLRMTNCPILRIWIGSIEGCNSANTMDKQKI
jgi:hypothetical protein